jgi:signal transduction histidine kinase
MGNVIAHSKASRVLIKLLSPSTNKFIMAVIDNGVGFNVKEGRKKSSGAGGIGLTGLYKRAFQINADLDIQSIIGGGTTVKIELAL